MLPKNKFVKKKVKEDFVTTVGEGEDAVEIRLPSLSYLRPGLLRQIRRMGETDSVFTIIEMSVSERAQEILDAMELDEWDALLDMWREHSGISMGES